MLISRLLPLSLLIAVSAVSVAAQSSPETNPAAVQSRDSAEANASGDIDLFSDLLSDLPSPSLNPEAKPLDRIRADTNHPRLNQVGLPHASILGPNGLEQADTFCYAIRGYKVARDNPLSDSTHAVSYSTCQPATRFHVHTTEERVYEVLPKP
jgi:hypothetical protein